MLKSFKSYFLRGPTSSTNISTIQLMWCHATQTSLLAQLLHWWKSMYTTDIFLFVCRRQLLTGSMTAMRRALWAGTAELGHQAAKGICTLLYILYTLPDWCHNIAAQASRVKSASTYLEHVAETIYHASLRAAAYACICDSLPGDIRDSLTCPSWAQPA